MYVATVLTVYGIETFNILFSVSIHNDTVATVLTVYGIETYQPNENTMVHGVATVLTVYGIETKLLRDNEIFVTNKSCNSTYRLRY